MANGPALLTAHLRKNRLSIRGFADTIKASPSAVHAWITRERRPGADARLAMEKTIGIPFGAWPKPRRVPVNNQA
jgi:hypothetical protein